MTAEGIKTAGVIVYRQGDNGLVGTWAHKDLQGHTGREEVADAQLATLAGEWPVKIWAPGGDDPFFVGTLSIEAVGAVWNLRWAGTQGANHESPAYEGVGVLLKEQGMLAASFEQAKG